MHIICRILRVTTTLSQTTCYCSAPVTWAEKKTNSLFSFYCLILSMVTLHPQSSKRHQNVKASLSINVLKLCNTFSYPALLKSYLHNLVHCLVKRGKTRYVFSSILPKHDNLVYISTIWIYRQINFKRRFIKLFVCGKIQWWQTAIIKFEITLSVKLIPVF